MDTRDTGKRAREACGRTALPEDEGDVKEGGGSAAFGWSGEEDSFIHSAQALLGRETHAGVNMRQGQGNDGHAEACDRVRVRRVRRSGKQQAKHYKR